MAQARTESRVEELAVNMTSFSTILNQLVIRSDRHEGTLLELKFRDRLPSYLDRFLRRGQVIQASDLIDRLEPKLAEAAVDDFLRADVVASGTVEGQLTLSGSARSMCGGTAATEPLSMPSSLSQSRYSNL
ncbi:MAG: hypothetical protein WCH77_11345 [Planctomycetota bacterium]